MVSVEDSFHFHLFFWVLLNLVMQGAVLVLKWKMCQWKIKFWQVENFLSAWFSSHLYVSPGDAEEKKQQEAEMFDVYFSRKDSSQLSYSQKRKPSYKRLHKQYFDYYLNQVFTNWTYLKMKWLFISANVWFCKVVFESICNCFENSPRADTDSVSTVFGLHGNDTVDTWIYDL